MGDGENYNHISHFYKLECKKEIIDEKFFFRSKHAYNSFIINFNNLQRKIVMRY